MSDVYQKYISRDIFLKAGAVSGSKHFFKENRDQGQNADPGQI